MTANLVLAPILTAIACKNIFESGKPGDPPVGLKDVDMAYIKRSMASNAKILAVASVAVVGVKATIDRTVRKKKEPISRYAADALLLAIDQVGRGNLSDVAFVDTFLKTDLPRRVEALIGTAKGIKGIAATTALGVGPLYVYKSLEYYFISNIYMKFLETPIEKIMSKSSDELVDLFTSDIYCLPDDIECAKYRQLVITHPPLHPASGGR